MDGRTSTRGLFLNWINLLWWDFFTERLFLL